MNGARSQLFSGTAGTEDEDMCLSPGEERQPIPQRPGGRVFSDHPDRIRLAKLKGRCAQRAQRRCLEGSARAVEEDLMLNLNEVSRANDRPTDLLAVDQHRRAADVVDLQSTSSELDFKLIARHPTPGESRNLDEIAGTLTEEPNASAAALAVCPTKDGRWCVWREQRNLTDALRLGARPDHHEGKALRATRPVRIQPWS